jgi:hypothetical protein
VTITFQPFHAEAGYSQEKAAHEEWLASHPVEGSIPMQLPLLLAWGGFEVIDSPLQNGSNQLSQLRGLSATTVTQKRGSSSPYVVLDAKY